MQTVVTALKLLEELAVRQPIGVSEFARDMNMPKSSMHRFLKSLEQAGWIRMNDVDRGQWVLTARPLVVSQYVARDLGIRDTAIPFMVSVRDQTRESVHLALPDGMDAVIVEVVESIEPVRIYWPAGSRAHMYATANGKAFLAHAGPTGLEALPKRLTAFTDRTITSRAALDAELQVIRDRGWALSCGELRDDIGSVAAPVIGLDGVPVASLSIFFPLHRLPQDGGAAYGDLIMSAARSVGRALHGSG